MKIYNKKTHSINRNSDYNNTFSITINFFEMIYDWDSYRLVDICGFIPLIKAEKINIDLPIYTQGEFIIKLKKHNVKPGEIYDYNDIAFTNGIDFQNGKVYYDEKKGIICIGDINFNNIALMINNNIVCVIDDNNILRCLYILIESFC